MEFPTVIHESWHPYLKSKFEGNQYLQDFLDTIIASKKFYPKEEHIFRVFSMPLHDIKIVIIGQDPYPNLNQAIGYAFAVNEGENFPPSLRVIATELINEFQDDNSMFQNIMNINDNHKWCTLQHWVDQGVFLLNTALTVEPNKIGSHMNYWEYFIWQVVSIIAKNVSPIWMLWGKKAKDLSSLIRRAEGDYKNVILTAAHPAAECYMTSGNAGFYRCNHFKIANKILSEQNKTIINW